MEERFRALADSVPVGIFLTDTEGMTIYSNKYLQTMAGYSPEEGLRTPWYHLIHPDEREEVIREWNKTLSAGCIFSKDTRLLTSSGIERWVDILLSSIDSEGERPAGFVGTVVDTTNRKLYEDRLRESEEKYRDLFDNAHDLIQSVDGTGRFVYVNKKWKDILGYNDKEVKDLVFTDILRKDYVSQCLEVFREIKSGKDIENVEAVFMTRDGEEIFVEGKVSAKMKDGRFVATRGIFRDVTERKRLEAQLLHSRKMEAIGQLAGGVAHGFNNMLTSIIGYADLLKVKIGDEDPLKKYVDNILQSSERAASLTRDILTYSRKDSARLRPFDINWIIRNSEELLLRVTGNDIEIRTFLTDEDLTVMADRHQIEMVLMNLAANSRDAMPNGGTFTISTEQFSMDDNFIKTHGYGRSGMSALLSVSDTGTGIDEKVKHRIFEPFFTTKEFGAGTGLGLSIVYGIVKQNNGYIEVLSETGKGTAFKIYFPLVN